MSLPAVFIFSALLLRMVSAAPPPSHAKPSDLPLALSDMSSKSYFGFVILLDMLNDTTKATLAQDVTFFVPSDQHLAEIPISPARLEEFILSHGIPDPMQFNELARLPTGTVFPSCMNSRMLRISTKGRLVFVNNAQIIAPNVCSSSTIKCHGIDAVIANYG
ncbi:hypothetical protein ACHQM5_025541 [Ranunculus cassubicifolius]